MDKRILKVMFNKSGGNASKNSYSPKISIPKTWIDELGITLEDREVEAILEGDKIIIKKVK